MEAVGLPIQFLQKSDRVEIFAAAMLVGNPFAGATPVVEVEHRGDRIHAQPIGVIFGEPVVRAGEQKGADLVAREVEDVGVPLGLKSLARVEMLIQRGPVETARALNASVGKCAGTQSRMTPMPR